MVMFFLSLFLVLFYSYCCKAVVLVWVCVRGVAECVFLFRLLCNWKSRKKVLIVAQYSRTKPHKTLITIVEILNCMMAVMPRYSSSISSMWCVYASPNVHFCIGITTYGSHNTISLHPFLSISLSALLHSLCLWFWLRDKYYIVVQTTATTTTTATNNQIWHLFVSWEIFAAHWRPHYNRELQFLIHLDFIRV